MSISNTIEAGLLAGSVQKYLDKTLFKEKKFITPLVQFATRGSLPEKSGQKVEYRWYGDMALPEAVAEGVEPSTGATRASYTLLRPIYELAEWFDMSNMLQATDWVDELPKFKDGVTTAFRRKGHLCVQDATMLTTIMGIGSTLYGETFTNTPFAKVYACGKPSFAQLTASDYTTLQDIWRAVMMLRLRRVPPYYGSEEGEAVEDGDGLYVAVISDGIEATLLEDPEYKDAVKRHEGMLRKSSIKGHIMDWRGVRWIRQTEPYKLAVAGDGVTRDDTGALEVVHVFGQNAFGTLKMGTPASQTTGGDINKPRFKVQDISVTGCKITCGARLFFSSFSLQDEHGVNVVGASKYNL